MESAEGEEGVLKEEAVARGAKSAAPAYKRSVFFTVIGIRVSYFCMRGCFTGLPLLLFRQF